MGQDTASPYVLLEKIGAGGGGEVHLARDRRLDRKVALKFLSAEAGRDAGARRRFVLEARAAAAIDHPFVCKVYEAGVEDERAFIAMEYVEGEALDAWLADGPPVEARLQVAREIAEAIQEAHAKGFLHRDLKPANLLVTPGGHVKVLDFGIAKELDRGGEPVGGDLTAAGFVPGTLEYLSPEQAAGETLDQRSDLFSFGIVLYEMFSGVHPFRQNTPRRSLMAILARDPPPLRDQAAELPPGLASVIDRLLAKEREERFASMADVREALARVGRRNGEEAPRDISHDSVAVLPFSRISPDEEDEYFVDGMTEEITTKLAKVEGLKVISRTSVMRLRGTNEDLRTIGRRLGVSTVVEGSVRRAANRVRIAARLIAVEADQQLWGEVYDRDLEDVFAVQADVSREIVLALKRSLSPAVRRRLATDEVELDVYHEYLKGRYSMHKLTPKGIRTGIRHFRETLELDPTYAPGHAGLAVCHAYSAHLGYEPFEEAFPQARTAAERALELDDSLAEAHVSLGLVALLHEWDWPAADRHFARSVELSPNFAAARLHYAWYFLAVGRNDRAISEAARAVELDPLSAFNHMALGWIQFYSGLYNESIVQYQRALDAEPDHAVSRDQIAGTYIAMGRHDEAIEILRDAVNPIHLAWAYTAAGRDEEADAVLARLTGPDSPVRPNRMDLAMVHLMRGDLDEGFRLLDEAFEERDSRLAYLPDHPFLMEARQDPRMTDLLRRMGLGDDPV